MSAETLLDIFVPPEGMVGYSAALVAMTGADDFLEDAVQRFTGLRPRQRAALGDVLVYLMLDGHASSSRQGVFPPRRIPGLHEFQPRAVAPGSLLHAKDGVPLQNDESPTALNVAGESAHRWVVPIVDAAGRVGWQPPRFDTYADALAALLDFPIRPAEATDDDDSDEEDGRDKSREKRPGERKGERSELEKTYALHAAAELIEKVAALQGALPESMLDD